MQPKNLLLASLIIAVVGVILLLIYVQTLQPKFIDAKMVDRLVVGKYVRMSGTVKSIDLRENSFAVRLCDSTCVTVHIPKDITQSIIEGDFLTVNAYVREYSGRSYLEVKNRNDVFRES